MSQAGEIIKASNHNVITERNNVYVTEREKRGAGVRTKEKKNEGKRMSAHKEF